MKIWILKYELDLYDNLKFKDWTLEKLESFNGSEKKDIWIPEEVIRLEPEKKLPLGDAPGFDSHIPVFSDKAKNVLEKYISDCVEILPLINDEKKFWLINVTNILDCIDYKNSKFETYDGIRIMYFDKYSFIEEKVKGYNIFRIKDLIYNSPFVSDEFRNAVIENGLEGFKFKLAWDSE